VFSSVSVVNSRPVGVRVIQKTLATELGVHTIVDIVDPATERGGIMENGGCQGLELVVICERGPTVLTGKDVGEEGKPGGDGTSVSVVADRLGGYEVEEFPAGGAPESGVHYGMRRFPACICVKFHADTSCFLELQATLQLSL
jgi:hypothetical protein